MLTIKEMQDHVVSKRGFEDPWTVYFFNTCECELAWYEVIVDTYEMIMEMEIGE